MWLIAAGTRGRKFITIDNERIKNRFDRVMRGRREDYGR
jgi:hypothetical protein